MILYLIEGGGLTLIRNALCTCHIYILVVSFTWCCVVKFVFLYLFQLNYFQLVKLLIYFSLFCRKHK